MANKSLSQSVIKKIQMSKALYLLGNSCFETSINHERIGIGVILLQDAVELFMIALCEYFKAEFNSDLINYYQYFNKLKEKVSEEIPFKIKMLKLNKQRINIKHHGFLPNIDDCKTLPSDVRGFFDELSTRYLKTNFDSISLISLLQDGKNKVLLEEAQIYLSKDEYRKCQINCRKVFFLTFESSFDIRRYENITENEPRGLAILLMMSNAPYYTRNKEYIEKNIKDPTDYIVLDHDRLDKELMKQGISLIDFWNIWRLTPSMYYYKENDEWVIKEEFRKGLYVRENAEYCLSKLVEMLLIQQQNSQLSKSAGAGGAIIFIKKQHVKVFEKALASSNIVSRIIHRLPKSLKYFSDFGILLFSGRGQKRALSS
ncbi:hypothetical protein ACFL52_02700 [Candidatus Margulisiibacteriota bacterium]